MSRWNAFYRRIPGEIMYVGRDIERESFGYERWLRHNGFQRMLFVSWMLHEAALFSFQPRPRP